MGAVKAAMQEQGLLGGDEESLGRDDQWEAWVHRNEEVMTAEEMHRDADAAMKGADRAMRIPPENSPTWPAICGCGAGKLNTICDLCHGAVVSQIDRDWTGFEQLRDYLEDAAADLHFAAAVRAQGDAIGAAFRAGVAYRKYQEQDIQALVHCLGVASGRIK